MKMPNLDDSIEIEFDHELSEADYAEDMNRLEDRLHLKNVQSREEWIERLDNYGIMTDNPGVRKFLDLWFRSRIAGYIDSNTQEEEKPKRKTKKWSKEDEDYIMSHKEETPKDLRKVFTSRTVSSIANKRHRLFRKALYDIPKGYGKVGRVFVRKE